MNNDDKDINLSKKKDSRLSKTKVKKEQNPLVIITVEKKKLVDEYFLVDNILV